MATTTLNTKLNVVEQAKRRASGMVVTIAEVLAETNDILKRAPMFEANDVYSHLETIRTKLPTISPRTINSGASKSASATNQIRETIMLLDVFCEIDEALIDHEPDPKKAMINEIKSFLEAAMQEFARIFIYGNPGSDSRECIGLATRYYVSTMDNVRKLSGSGADTTSVYMIEWGEQLMKLIYPRGAKNVGIDHQDDGKIRVTDDDGNPYKAYSHQIKMEFGMSVPDDRAVQRLANIESAGSSNNLAASTDVRQLVYMRNSLPHMGKNAVLYANRDTKSQMDIYGLEKTNGFYTKEDITGVPVTTFQGIPIDMIEQIASDETAIS